VTASERSDAGIVIVQEVFGMVNANVSIASGAKRKAGDERQDTGRLGISKNQLGRDAGNGRLLSGSFISRMSFGRLFLGGLLAIRATFAVLGSRHGASHSR